MAETPVAATAPAAPVPAAAPEAEPPAVAPVVENESTVAAVAEEQVQPTAPVVQESTAEVVTNSVEESPKKEPSE